MAMMAASNINKQLLQRGKDVQPNASPDSSDKQLQDESSAAASPHDDASSHDENENNDHTKSNHS